MFSGESVMLNCMGWCKSLVDGFEVIVRLNIVVLFGLLLLGLILLLSESGRGSCLTIPCGWSAHKRLGHYLFGLIS